MKNEPVLITMSVLAGLQIIVTGSALADVIGASVAALAVLVVAGAQVAMQFYVRGKVTPTSGYDPRRDAG